MFATRRDFLHSLGVGAVAYAALPFDALPRAAGARGGFNILIRARRVIIKCVLVEHTRGEDAGVRRYVFNCRRKLSPARGVTCNLR